MEIIFKMISEDELDYNMKCECIGKYRTTEFILFPDLHQNGIFYINKNFPHADTVKDAFFAFLTSPYINDPEFDGIHAMLRGLLGDRNASALVSCASDAWECFWRENDVMYATNWLKNHNVWDPDSYPETESEDPFRENYYSVLACIDELISIKATLIHCKQKERRRFYRKLFFWYGYDKGYEQARKEILK